MDGLQDVIFVKMYALGINQCHTTIIMKLPKEWIKNLNIDSLIGMIKLGKKILKELH